MAGLLIFFGGLMWFLGRRGERKEAEEIALARRDAEVHA
jgi:hypothetical protein